MPVKEVRLKWNPVQSRFLQAKERYIDLEGAIRAGKSTPAIWKIINFCQEYPGIHCLIARWNDKTFKGQLKPLFYDSCPRELLKAWHSDEGYQEFWNGSRVYMRGLKSSQDSNRYANLAGMTLAVIYVDQPEEMEADFHTYLMGRLSQPGYPHQLIYTPNPPDHDHWLTKAFPDGSDPTTPSKPDHLYLRTSIHDNAQNLDPQVIKALVEQFPVGSVEYRRMIEGRRGLSIIGEAVYKGYFRRDLHVREILPLADVPLIRGWDFGHRHPAVSWWQFTPWGGLRCLHEVMGDAQFIDDFAPLVCTVTQTLFPDCRTIWDCCDPAGADKQGHGLRRTAVDVLRDLGVYPRFVPGSNDPARRDFAIQTLGRYMMKLTKQGAAFEVHPRCRTLIDGFEAGYVWEDLNRSGSLMPNTRRPRKDGYYDHLQNCYSADTDILTARGWIPFPQLEDGEYVATVNLQTDTVEYQQPSRIVREAYEGDLIHFHAKMDVLVTPNHRMVVYRRDQTTPTIVPAEDCTIWDRVKLHATWEGAMPLPVVIPAAGFSPERQVDPYDWAEFLGWYVSEGSAAKRVVCPGRGYRVIISQMHSAKRERIWQLLQRLPWSWQVGPRGFSTSSKQLWEMVRPLGDKYTKCVPQWLLYAHRTVIQRFLEAAVLGDGYQAPSGHRQYFSVSPVLADQMQELFFKAGTAASITKKAGVPYTIQGRSGSNVVPQYHLNEWQCGFGYLRDSQNGSKITRVPYEGLVYCAVVPNGTLVVRRNGRPAVCGNTAEYVIINYGGAGQGDKSRSLRPVRDVDPADRPVTRPSRAGY